MRRYRVINPRFDTRALLLGHPIEDHWEDEVKAGWHNNKESLARELEHELGREAFDVKLARFIELGAEPFSVIAYHNAFLRECRYAFVIGSFYPALTGACALGERILNHLVMALRDDHKGSPLYKKVYDKDSFDNWDRMIEVLLEWEVLGPGAADAFADLKVKRNAAIHFDPATDHNAPTLALEAVRSLQVAIEAQFGIGPKPWFIKGAPHPYVAQAAEETSFVKRVILTSPSVALVGPKAQLEFDDSTGAFRVADMGDAGPPNGSDADFVALIKG